MIKNLKEIFNMGKINKEWHLKNKMPKNPSFEERMEWHIKHMENCSCREPTPKLKEEMKLYLKKK
jgi:hypothetical protein